MSKKQQIKRATKRVQNNKKVEKKTKSSQFWKKVWNIICWPFRMLARGLKWLWKWLCDLNVIGIVNLTLLVAIVVLFSMLIIDIANCNRQTVVVRSDVVQTPVLPTKATQKRNVVARPVKPVTNTLPMAFDAKTREAINEPIVAAPAKPCPMLIKQIAVEKNKIMGDTVIDGRNAATTIRHNTKIHGNLYLQNMRKYTLPCGVKINGNLFLRDVNMLQFCGEFTVTGNIYVSPRSSFGPIPATARLGGYVVL